MAEFTAGDRVVKMSGIAAGKYGTVNSVREDGTLNVTFDGERMARFCDPERCGKVAANAKYKTGDFVKELASDRTWRVGRMGNDTVELWQWPGSGMTVTTIREVEDGNRFIPAPQVAESWKKAHANACAANAKSDTMFSKYANELVQLYNKLNGRNSVAEGKREGRINDILRMLSSFGVKAWVMPDGKVWIQSDKPSGGKPFRSLLNSLACNRASVFEYGVGDTVKLRSGRTGEVLSKYVDKSGDIKIDVDLNGTRFPASSEMIDAVVKNSRACNAVARNFTEDQLRKYLTYRYYSYKGNLYFTGSEESAPVWVLYDDKRDGEKWTLRACKNRGVEAMLSKAHPEWNFCQISDLQRKQNEEAKIRKIVEAELRKMGKTIANAEITPELRKAYDEWMKAKAKFDKWWNPDRRLSERPPKGADATRKQLDFAAVFKKVTGKLTPNGYGSMTLEQMVDAVSKNAVARNGLSPYGAVSGLLALKWYDKKDDKGGGVMIVRAPFEAVKRYLEQSARNYPYKIAPYGRGWAKVTAPFEW